LAWDFGWAGSQKVSKMKNKLFKMGGEIDFKTSAIVGIVGFICIIFIWYLITTFGGISNTIFPKPQDVVTSFGELQSQYGLVHNIWYSVKLNFLGYFEAVAISIPLGFFIGLFPICRSLFSKWVDAVRFVPLTAVTGLFIGWFGIELGMKVHFLAFGIIIYLLPIIVQRIDNVDKIYLQTAWTIGASNWKTFKHVYFPSVVSKISDDIRVMVAISWTYIIVAELINKEGGVGALIFTATKQSRADMVFAILLIIIFIGYLQDLLFKSGDKFLFPYKYESSQVKSKGLRKYFVKDK
jgi:NitT/TauT family transport system permease protein